MKTWLPWVVFTIFCWGSYVVTLHAGQLALRKSSLHAFLFVGIAYFGTAVLIPGSWIVKTESWDVFSLKGGALATLAGLLGALGALGIILALKNGGSPLVIPSLVFAGAPVVNVFLSMFLHPPHSKIAPQFFIGCLLAALSTYLILTYRPN